MQLTSIITPTSAQILQALKFGVHVFDNDPQANKASGYDFLYFNHKERTMPLLGATYNRETLIPADVFVMEKQLQMNGAPRPYVLIVPVGLKINLPLEIQVIHSDELLVPGTDRGHAVLVSMTESPMPLGMDVCVARNLEIAV